MRPYRYHASAWAVLIIGLILTGVAWFYTNHSFELYASSQFNTQASRIRDLITGRMQTYVNSLIQTRGLFIANGQVNRKQFHDYFQNTDIQQLYPGIQGVGFALRLSPSQKQRHEGEMRKGGMKGYHVWPESKAKDSFPIVFLEPHDWRNQRAIGFDMNTDLKRRAAMEQARDTGKPALSSPVTLVQDLPNDLQPGLLLYAPVYRLNLPTQTVAQRRKALVGFVYSPFRSSDLFGAIFDAEKGDLSGLEFEIYDGNKRDPARLIFDSYRRQRGNGRRDARYSNEETISIAGHQWTIYTASLPGFEVRSERYGPALVLVFGCVISLLLFQIVWRNQRHAEAELALLDHETQARREAEAAAERSRFLTEAGRILSGSLDWKATLENLAKLAVPKLSDLCYVDMVDQDHNIARTIAFAHADPDKQALVEELFQKFPPRWDATRGSAVVLRTGRPELYSEFNEELLHKIANDSEHVSLLKKLGFRSAMIVPLVARGRTLGAMTFVAADSARSYSEEDLAMAIELAREAGLAVDNARLYQESQEAIRARDEFLSIASHELKTPLTPLKLQLQTVRRMITKGDLKTLTPEKVARIFETSDYQVLRITRLVEELLDVSRISIGKLSLQAETVDVVYVAKDVVDRFCNELKKVHCKAEINAPKSLVMETDRLRFEQIVINLLTNAAKYAPGKPIHISFEDYGQSMRLVVRDEGPGIAKEDQQRIFERFERAVSARHFGGLGLGLYITRQIVQAHGGQIRVESEAGKGSSFIVDLPKKLPQTSSAVA